MKIIDGGVTAAKGFKAAAAAAEIKYKGLYLAFHTLILPTYAETGSCTNIHLLSLIPAGVYLLHAGWIKIRK